MVNLENIFNNPALCVGTIIKLKPIIKNYYYCQKNKKSPLIKTKFITKQYVKEFKRINSSIFNE